MKKHTSRTLTLLAVLAAVGLGAAITSFTRTQAAETAKAPASSVAVVKIREVMKRVNMYAAMQETQKKGVQAVEKELKARKDKLEALREQAKDLDPKSQTWQNLDAQFSEDSIQLDGWLKYQKEKISRSDAAALLVLYKQACSAASDLAEQKGFDILLAETLTQDQLNKEVRLEDASRIVNGDREVLFARKSVDITEDVIAKMNNDFNQRGAATPPSSIAAPKPQ